jgi:hypothetical protein
MFFFIFSDYFNILILKITFENKKYYFNIKHDYSLAATTLLLSMENY